MLTIVIFHVVFNHIVIKKQQDDFFKPSVSVQDAWLQLCKAICASLPSGMCSPAHSTQAHPQRHMPSVYPREAVAEVQGAVP